MSGQLLSSKVVIVEEEPTVRGIPTVPSSVAGAVGLTERGPIGQALLCSSFEEYQTRFGGFTADSDLALAAMGFFENGGSQLWVVRTVHYTNTADPDSHTALRATGFLVAGSGPTPAVLTGVTPSPFALQDGDRLVLSANGGADVDVVFHGAPAEVSTGAAGPYPLADGQTLLLRVDRGPEQQAILRAADFSDITHATAAEVAAALNAAFVGGRATASGGSVHLASDTEGTSSRVQVLGGTANAALGLATTAAQGSGNVASIHTVQLAEAKALIEAAVPGVVAEGGLGGVLQVRTLATGTSATLRAQVGTAAAFGLPSTPQAGSASGAVSAIRVEGRDPGAYANRLEAEVRAATDGSASAFDLLVIEDGVYQETFPNLSMEPDSPRHVERIVNDERTGSLYVRVSDQRLPTAPMPTVQTVTLTGGSDGLVGLDDNDFIGSEAGKTGLHALDQVQELSLLLVPGPRDARRPQRHGALLRGRPGRHGVRHPRSARRTRVRRPSSPTCRRRRHSKAPPSSAPSTGRA